MTDWTSGYMAETDYTHDFYRTLTPAHLAFCAQALGQKHRLNTSDVTYCELGCGHGFSANLLAAANPHIEFHAMDFNPAFVAGAENLAQDAKLDNVHFYEEAFDSFSEAPGLPPSFDVIALHGVYSWVSKENRKHILDFISTRLKPGGLVYISYNTMPGWAEVLPLRQLLADRTARGTGPIAQRISDALTYVEGLQESGARYFTALPGLADKIRQMKTMSANYLAHELCNKDWTPFHFEEVAKDLAQAKLCYLGSADPMEQVDDINLTAEQRTLLDSEQDPVRRQGLRDILTKEQFRTDIFVKGVVKHTPRSTIGAWFSTPLALTRHYGGGPLRIKGGLGEVDFYHNHYAPILRALDGGPQTIRALLDEGTFGTSTWAEITRTLMLLVGAGYIAPCPNQGNDQERQQRCRSFNMAVCKRAEDSEELRFLASPVTGGGIALDRFEQLFLLAQSEGQETPEDWANLVWQILAPQGQRLQHEGRILETPEENLAILRARAATFAKLRLPLLRDLGVTLGSEVKSPQQTQAVAA